ncbi:MAG TPA: bifunctional diguanylate cyclase/phosphodiesterase [Micromonosporaceae bacterium]|nr:bifunctional diguanylate cyclase/phosphodiesterase [Micromonosporaceae bacterium]
MTPEPVNRTSPGSAGQTRVGDLTTLIFIGAALLLAAGGQISYPAATAVAVTVATGVNGTRLIRLALAIHGQRHTFGPCRGAGFLGLGVVIGGATVIAGTGTGSALLAAPGAGAAAVAYLLGLLLLPGAAPTVAARLRRLLDGFGLAACLLLMGWLLVAPGREGRSAIATAPADLGSLPLLVTLTTSAALAIAALTGLGAARYRRAALACAGGAALCLLGLATLVLTVAGAWTDGDVPTGPLVTLVCLVVGPRLMVAGARSAGDGPSELTALDADGTFAGYPLLAVPLVGALVAAAYHGIVVGRFDALSAVLGAAAVGALILREALGIMDVRRYAGRLAAQGAHFRSLVAGSTDVTIVVDDDLVVRWQSPAAARQFGLSDADVLGRALPALVHPDDQAAVREALTAVLAGDRAATDQSAAGARLLRARLRDGFGRWRDTESAIIDQRAVPSVGALVLHLRDVAERTDLERTVARLAWSDQLTGLANRDRFLAATDELQATSGAGAVLVIELDGFAGVNGLRGHDVGDTVLVEVARRLRDCVRAGDVVARLGADEFAVLSASGPVRAYALAHRVVAALGEPYPVPGAAVHLSACVGVAEVHDAAAEEAVRHAGLALRRARQIGRGRVESYDESIEVALTRRMAIEQALPEAIARGELDLVYQPILDLVTRRPIAVEALLRWRHPILGLIAPAELIPIAEDLEIAEPVTAWVLHQACRQLSQWTREGRQLWVGVNTTPRQLASDSFLTTVAGALDTHGVPAEQIVLEVAEHWLDTTATLAAQLAGLRALGVRTAIDHFGAGPGALAHMRRLPVDVLKVDRALFTEPAGRSAPATPILDVVVELGRRLGIDVVATGLEDSAQLDAAQSAGCRYGQGHLFARPAHAEHVEAFLETHRNRLR